MGYDLSDDRLLLHTIQAEAAFEGLLSTGVLEPDPSRVELATPCGRLRGDVPADDGTAAHGG